MNHSVAPGVGGACVPMWIFPLTTGDWVSDSNSPKFSLVSDSFKLKPIKKKDLSFPSPEYFFFFFHFFSRVKFPQFLIRYLNYCWSQNTNYFSSLPSSAGTCLANRILLRDCLFIYACVLLLVVWFRTECPSYQNFRLFSINYVFTSQLWMAAVDIFDGWNLNFFWVGKRTFE